MKQTQLTEKNIKEGLIIIMNDHPEYGNWKIEKDNNGWNIRNRSGVKILIESEMKYYSII